jgi:membrane protease YdiL (CAAX protease family)/uncharacterized RDD family membrane protein YckC
MAIEPPPGAPAGWGTPVSSHPTAYAAQVPRSWAPAGVWRRIGAGALDLTLIVVAAFVVMAATAPVLGPAPPSGVEPSPTDLLIITLAMAVILFGPPLYLALGWRSGATVGMRAAGLWVVDARTGDRPSLEQVLLRLVGSFYSLLPLGAGLIAAAGRPDRRGWQDRMSGTAVVHGRPVVPAWAWDGRQWVWSLPTAVVSSAPVPTERQLPPSRPPRSAWTWTDVVPLLVLFLPAAWLGQLAVVVALHVVRVGHGHPAAISLLLDVVAYGVDLALIWVFLGLRRHARLADLGLRLPHWTWLLAALPAVLCSWAAEGVLGAIGRALLPASPGSQCAAIQSDYHSALVLGLIGVAVVAPVVEEILFRGVVFGWLRGRMPAVAAAVISAALFSLAHLGWMDWALLLPVFGIGLVLAGLYHHSRSLWPGILVHASVNTAATLFILLAPPGHC